MAKTTEIVPEYQVSLYKLIRKSPYDTLIEWGVGLASLKQIGGKTWEEFVFESFMV